MVTTSYSLLSNTGPGSFSALSGAETMCYSPLSVSNLSALEPENVAISLMALENSLASNTQEHSCAASPQAWSKERSCRVVSMAMSYVGITQVPGSVQQK